MNRVLYYSSIILLFSAGFTACKKPSGDAARNPDKLRISRVTQSTVLAPQKVNVTDFIFDDQNRVNKIAYSYEETVNGSLTTQPRNGLTYYYNGTDKNPYKASGEISINGWIADIYYTYNTVGMLVRDSAKGTGINQVLIHDYTYSPDKIIVKKRTYFIMPPGGTTGNTLTDSVVIKNNNIAEIVYATGSIGQSAYYFQVSYDDKINPMSKLNIAPVKVTEGLKGFPDILAPGICRNNITAYTTGIISYSGNRTEKAMQPYKFTYTKEGLPETCKIYTPYETYTITYTYEDF
jgi:hypothetical protein